MPIKFPERPASAKNFSGHHEKPQNTAPIRIEATGKPDEVTDLSLIEVVLITFANLVIDETLETFLKFAKRLNRD